MNQERLGSPAQFAEELARHLAAVAAPGQPLPGDQDLAALVDLTFFASLHEEEARRTRFNVAWQPSETATPAVLTLAAPVIATPKGLAKLAPATQHDSTSIAIERRGADLVAWALVQPRSADESPLTIRVLGPGVLRADHAGLPRALYARGETLLWGGPHDVLSPSALLTSTFRQWSAEADPAAGVDLRAAVVVRLAARALEHGHGGMILLVPADAGDLVGIRVHHAVAGGADVLAARYADVVRDVPVDERLARLRGSRARAADGRVTVRDQAQIAFAEALDLVAQLTAIDNALLIDTELQLRGFGVQVVEGDSPSAAFEHTDPYSHDVHTDDLSTFKGTRHPAGVVFCMRQRSEAAAIIASQDGRLSLATRDQRGVVAVLGSYERAFGWR